MQLLLSLKPLRYMAMRKAVNLKVFVMVMAWMVIFLHDAIPHNHINSPDHSCHAVIHSVGPDSDLISAKHDQAEHIAGLYTIFIDKSHSHGQPFVCHFSTGPYQGQLLDMSAAILTDNPFYLFSQKIVIAVVPATVSPVIRPPLRLSLLRGPPHNA